MCPGRPQSVKRPGESRLVGTLQHAGMEMPPLVKYAAMPFYVYFEGELEESALHGRMLCSLIKDIAAAGEIVRSIANEAREILVQRRLVPFASLVRACWSVRISSFRVNIFFKLRVVRSEDLVVLYLW
jgi:hypothetical protein